MRLKGSRFFYEDPGLAPDADIREQFAMELETEREIARSELLAPFRRNGSCWELLLMLAAQGGESDLGLYKTLDTLETSFLGQSAMLKFVRDCRDAGLLIFDQHEKRSMSRLRLAPEVHAALIAVLSRRNKSKGSLYPSADERYHNGIGSEAARQNGMMKC